MSLTLKTRTMVLVLVAFALALSFAMSEAAVGPQNPTKPPEPGSSGTCTYCSEPACGCPDPPPGCIGRFNCVCSSIQCEQVCRPCG